MNTVIRHTEYLISRNDCVIIPGLGAVLANYASAQLLDASIVAPCRCYSFNSGLSVSDGVLATSIARARGISNDAAAEIIRREVDAMRHQLYNSGTLALGHIGTLTLTAGAIEFEPQADELSVATAWLPNVEPAAAKPEMPEAKEYYPIRVSPFVRFVRKVAAVLIMLGICMVASTPLKVDDVAKASLCPEIHKLTPADFAIDEPEPAAEDPQVILATFTASKWPAIEIVTGPKFCLIVSSHSTKTDAERFISYHPGENLSILESNGRYRVYVSEHTSEVMAYAACKEISAKYPSAWVCKK